MPLPVRLILFVKPVHSQIRPESHQCTELLRQPQYILLPVRAFRFVTGFR
jgi:hypothetical protein